MIKYCALITVLLLHVSGSHTKFTWYPKATPPTPVNKKHLPWIFLKHEQEISKDIFGRILNYQIYTSKVLLKEQIKFCLYTQKNNDTWEEIFVNESESLKESNFNTSYPTTIIVHGYMTNINWDLVQHIKNELLKRGEHNIIGVDWGEIAITLDYDAAVEGTKQVGLLLANLIDFMVEKGLNLSTLHLIGHSLGAHAAGFAAKNIISGRIPRVTGLDPARPGFENVSKSERLDEGDAEFVDCIHTSSGELGLTGPFCTTDFYPNGGTSPQPGCSWFDLLGYCSHARSYIYYTESIKADHIFPAMKCTKFPEILPSDCHVSSALMGYSASPKHPGVYYVVTNSESPFSPVYSSQR